MKFSRQKKYWYNCSYTHIVRLSKHVNLLHLAKPDEGTGAVDPCLKSQFLESPVYQNLSFYKKTTTKQITRQFLDFMVLKNILKIFPMWNQCSYVYLSSQTAWNDSSETGVQCHMFPNGVLATILIALRGPAGYPGYGKKWRAQWVRYTHSSRYTYTCYIYLYQ